MLLRRISEGRAWWDVEFFRGVVDAGTGKPLF